MRNDIVKDGFSLRDIGIAGESSSAKKPKWVGTAIITAGQFFSCFKL